MSRRHEAYFTGLHVAQQARKAAPSAAIHDDWKARQAQQAGDIDALERAIDAQGERLNEIYREGASACSPCVASHGESACGVQVDSEARCGAPDPVAVPTQRGRASSIHAPSEKVPAGSESPLSAGLRSTSGGVESRHAGSAASLNWGVGAAQVKTASADTTADLSGESGMPSVQLRPAGMRPEVRPHADNQGTAGVAPGPLTLNAATEGRPTREPGRGVVPVHSPSAAAPIPYERDVLAGCLKALALHRRVAWAHRMNVGGMVNAAGQHVRFGFNGCSDIVGQLVTGEFLAIECKRPGERPTDDQVAFLGRVQRAGGVAFVAWSIDDIARGLA